MTADRRQKIESAAIERGRADYDTVWGDLARRK
jgi:hypothetical protein